MPRLEVLKHNDKEITGFLDRVSQINLDRSHYLIIFIGAYQAGKTNLIKRLQKKIGEFIEIDLSTVISQNEEESYKNIDELFSVIAKSDKNILFNHGDVLAGQYTGYTYSSVRYATPQEKYFLKKIQKLEKIILLDILDEDNVDKTLERNSHFTLSFNKPTSILKRFTWSLGNYSFHGHQIVSKRPQRKT